jgi:predicted nucleic acid-binding protein
MKVVDASVVLGWVLDEAWRPATGEVLEDHVTGREPLVAPELLHYEVANVLVRGARLDASLGRDAYDRFVGLDVETYALGRPEYGLAIVLAVRHGVTVYDASYAALAKELDCPLVTADRRLGKALGAVVKIEIV